jgi:acyl-coenzyme A synthetase/AMP-(fatty) acid ligase/acyl carrier protein
MRLGRGVADDKRRLVDLIRSHPDGRTAVEAGERTISYGELGRLIDERAAALRAAGGGAGAFVAIERRKSAEFVVDYLSVLALGGTVVPIDPDTPAERRRTFLELTRPELLARDAEIVPLAGDPGREAPDGAFVYFTSGSTGVPKPVLGSAVALRSFLDWFVPEFGVGRDDRFAFVAGVSFEASLRDIFPPLAAGASLVVPDDDGTATPAEAVAWLAREEIGIVTVVPSVARTWLSDGRTTCPAVRAVFFVGEPVPADVLTGWRARFPRTSVRVNSYGSTEGGQATIYKRLGEDAMDRVPAGRPVPGTRYCFIDREAPLDPDTVQAALEQGPASGEIVIVSRACSHGYLGLPEENDARFADLGDGVTAYRTGDLGRVDEGGDLLVIGRVDDEVKINGVRVHPAEVTRAIRAHPAVVDAFVIATSGDDPSLRAYVVGDGVSIAQLRRDLMEVLPLAMIPARFVSVPRLPTARTGKVDRAALVALAEQAPGADGFVAPSGDVERWLADRFSELLGVERVSARDDLFALGGDSITAVRLAARIRDELGVDLSPRAVFAAAAIADLAAAIVDQQLRAADPDDLLAALDALEA